MTGKLQVVTRPTNDTLLSASYDAGLDRVLFEDMVDSERFNASDDEKMELETLVKLNGALQRALKDSDTELLSTMHGALQEQRRLRERLKEVLRETSLKKAENENLQSEAEAKLACPAVEKVLTLKKRGEELVLRIQLMEMKERTAEEQAKVLEAQIEVAEREKTQAPEPSPEKEATKDGGEEHVDEGGTATETSTSTPQVSWDVTSEEPMEEEEAEEDREKKLEEERQKVLERSQSATHKLLELRTQNQQLRHELKWARKVLSNEVGDPATVAAAMEAVAGNGSQWRGRSEQMSLLQHRLSELQEQLLGVQQECAHMEKRRRDLTKDLTSDGDPLPDEANILETAAGNSVEGGGASGVGGVWGAASAAAQERRRAAEADEREARAAQRTADAQAEAHRQHNAAAEAGIRAARDRVAHLAAKATHDKQLAQAVAEQVRAAEAQVKQRDHQREAAFERFQAERISLEQQLVRTKSVASHLKIVQEEKKKILEGLNSSMGSRESGRSVGQQAMGRGSAGQQREDFARVALLRRVLQKKEEERGRLQRLVDHLSARLAEMVREGAVAKDALRRERQRTAALETEIGRLELQRPGGACSGNEQRRAALEHGDFRGRASHLGEENASLRSRLERLIHEREAEVRTYAAIFDQRGLLERLRRSPSWAPRPATCESSWSAKPCVSDGRASPHSSTYGEL